MVKDNFQFSFTTSRLPKEIFPILSDPANWWIGLYNEVIKGSSKKVNDEFTFSAGGGAHFSRQRVVELTAGKRIVWLVTESNLSFLAKKDEWNNTKICFDIESQGKITTVTFTHEGLSPQIECYDGCSSAWSMYLENLRNKLKKVG